MIGTGRKVVPHKVQEPRGTDPDSPADTAQGTALAQQVFNQRALLVSNNALFVAGHKLASAYPASMILFAAVTMTVSLELCRSTPWACISDDHGGR
jgi:hypothetical protein